MTLGPAALAGGIQRGDVICWPSTASLSAPHVNLDALLENKIESARRPEGVEGLSGATAPRRMSPCVRSPSATERGLRYRQWVAERRDYVAKVSDGRLGYVHMPDMSAASLAQLYVDLDADNIARDGVVIDVRNNNGGFVNVYALDVLSRQPYLNMTQRGTPTWPARSLLGQRSLEQPTVLVTNQHSLSDAEDFTEGYRAMKLGKVVGEPTAGWIIYHVEHAADGRDDPAAAALADYRSQRRADGDAPAAGRRRGETAHRGELWAAAIHNSTRRSRHCSRP